MNKTNGIILLLLLVLLTSCENNYIKQNVGNNPVKNVTDAIEINSTNNTEIDITTEPPNIYLPRKDNLSIYVMDIDGEAILLQQDENIILINSGYETDSKRILNNMRKVGIEQANIIIATNTQPKNIGGLPYIILRSEPKIIYDTGFPSISTYHLLNNDTLPITIDQSITLGDLIIKFIVPYDDGLGFSSNLKDNSIITKISYGSFDILFMSDCGQECEERLYPYTNFNADIIKISGDCDANTFSLLQNVKPDIAIYTSNDTLCNEAYDRYDYINIPVLITKEIGDVVITTDGLDYAYYPS